MTRHKTEATVDWETLGACNTYQFTVLPVQSDELLSKTMRGEISFS